MGKQLSPHEELHLWKAAWDELEGYLVRGLGHYKMTKAKIMRRHIRRPMPNDIPHMIALGSKQKACANALDKMAAIKNKIYHGRQLTPWQDAKLQEEETKSG